MKIRAEEIEETKISEKGFNFSAYLAEGWMHKAIDEAEDSNAPKVGTKATDYAGEEVDIIDVLKLPAKQRDLDWFLDQYDDSGIMRDCYRDPEGYDFDPDEYDYYVAVEHPNLGETAVYVWGPEGVYYSSDEEGVEEGCHSSNLDENQRDKEHFAKIENLAKEIVSYLDDSEYYSIESCKVGKGLQTGEYKFRILLNTTDPAECEGIVNSIANAIGCSNVEPINTLRIHSSDAITSRSREYKSSGKTSLEVTVPYEAFRKWLDRSEHIAAPADDYDIEEGCHNVDELKREPKQATRSDLKGFATKSATLDRAKRAEKGNWKNSVGEFVEKHSAEIGNVSPLGKDALVNYIETKMKPELSDEAKEKVDELVNSSRSITDLMFALYNTMLKGAGMGLHEGEEDQDMDDAYYNKLVKAYNDLSEMPEDEDPGLYFSTAYKVLKRDNYITGDVEEDIDRISDYCNDGYGYDSGYPENWRDLDADDVDPYKDDED